jgi:hypothetical protein
MHKWIVEQWRDGECVRRLEIEVQQHQDKSLTVQFPQLLLAGGWVIATGDTLEIKKSGES